VIIVAAPAMNVAATDAEVVEVMVRTGANAVTKLNNTHVNTKVATRPNEKKANEAKPNDGRAVVAVGNSSIAAKSAMTGRQNGVTSSIILLVLSRITKIHREPSKCGTMKIARRRLHHRRSKLRLHRS
jgi:hypothetical protein